MIRTITIASCVAIQGRLVEFLADGRAVVRVGNRLFCGDPVPHG